MVMSEMFEVLRILFEMSFQFLGVEKFLPEFSSSGFTNSDAGDGSQRVLKAVAETFQLRPIHRPLLHLASTSGHLGSDIVQYFFISLALRD
jgi:hypothetical protein